MSLWLKRLYDEIKSRTLKLGHWNAEYTQTLLSCIRHFSSIFQNKFIQFILHNIISFTLVIRTYQRWVGVKHRCHNFLFKLAFYHWKSVKIVFFVEPYLQLHGIIESFYRSNQFHFAVYWSNHAYKFLKKQFRKKSCRCQE